MIVKEIIVWKIPPKGVIISDFICTFAMLLMIFACHDCNTEVSGKSDLAKSWVAWLFRLAFANKVFVAQEFIEIVKLMCCSI